MSIPVVEKACKACRRLFKVRPKAHETLCAGCRAKKERMRMTQEREAIEKKRQERLTMVYGLE